MFLSHPHPIRMRHSVNPAPLLITTKADFNFCQPDHSPIPTYPTARVNDNTMLLFPDGHAKSIIIDRQIGAQITPHSTRKLMQAYNHRQLIDFSQTRHFCHCFGHDRKYPQINGEYQFLPLTGTKHQNAPWIALHYIKAYEQHQHQLLLTFLDGGTCLLPYKGRQLTTEIHQCAAIGRILCTSLSLCATNFGLHLDLSTCFKDSVIHQFDDCDCPYCQKVPRSAAELVALLKELEISKSNYIYTAARREYSECSSFNFLWYANGVPEFLKELHRL